MEPLNLYPAVRMKTLFIFLAFVFPTACLFSQLSGTRTVDPGGGGDYLSIAEAVDDLNTQGVGGPLTINIKPGPVPYDENFRIGPFPGAGPANPVTIQALPEDSGQVIIAYSYASFEFNYIFNFDSASYVTLRRLVFNSTRGYFDMTKAIYFTGTANNIEISNNVFYGKEYSSDTWGRCLINSASGSQNNILIRNNHFSSCNSFINLRGHYPDSLASGLVIRDNFFDGPVYYSINLQYYDNPVIENNVFTNPTGYTGGINLQVTYNGFTIRNNRMEMYNGPCVKTWTVRGSEGNPGVIANNFFTNHIGSGANSGILLGDLTEKVKIYHNSVLISVESAEGLGVCLTTGTSGSDIDVQNNIFANMAGGLIYRIQDPALITASDYNNYFTTGENLALWDETSLGSMEDLIAMGPGDSHSLSVYPGFFSDTDLHTTSFLLDGKGTDLSSLVSTDIDGEPRSGTPDIGADEFTGTGAPLAGDYTIGGIGADYLHIRDAVNDLNQYGISAPVRFLVRDDDSPYNEQFSILPITGADAANRVTIQPHPFNEKQVELTCDHISDTKKYIIEIQGSSYLTIKDLRFQTALFNTSNMIRLNGKCNYDSISNCRFNNYNGNHIGNACVYCSSGDLEGLVIKSNRFVVGQEGIRFEASGGKYLEGFKIDSNYFNNNDDYGIYLDGCRSFSITGNTVWKGDAITGYISGILIQNCLEGFRVDRNQVKTRVIPAIHILNTTATADAPGIISNNFIYSMDEYTRHASIYCQDSRHIAIYHNTVSREGLKPDVKIIPLRLSGGGDLSVRNNIFCNPYAGEAAVMADEGLIADFSHNAILSGSNSLVKYNGIDYTSLEELESLLGKSLNCIEMYPVFPSEDDYHTTSVLLDGAGDPSTGITHDMDGDLRSDPPDIGADEFTTGLTPIPAGTYTVGGASPDYGSFTSFLEDLQLRGIAGPVVFSIRKDVYPEKPDDIYHIPGSSPRNTVLIRSESGNPDDVLLYGESTLSNDYILELVSASHLEIMGISMAANGTYGGCVSIEGGIDDIGFTDCKFRTANLHDHTVRVNANSKGLEFRNNTITGGTIGISLTGWSEELPAVQSRLIDNRYDNCVSYGIKLQYQDSPEVLNNEINNESNTGFRPIYLSDCYDAILINGNTIINKQSERGIVLVYCKAALPHRILVANNQVRVGGTAGITTRGIGIGSCERVGVYYNSIHITSPDTTSTSGIYVSNDNTGINVVNNIVANSGGGYAYHVYDAFGVFTSDHNNYYTTGKNLALWVDTEIKDIADLQSISGKEANSLSLDPLFVSDTDLHSNELALNEMGMPLLEIDHDADSLQRDPVKPDLGAFENTCGTPKFNIEVISGCLGDSTIFIDNSTGIDPGSKISWDFTGDFIPEIDSVGLNETVKYLFPEPGIHTVNIIVDQFPDCLDSKAVEAEVYDPPELDPEVQGAYCDASDGSVTVSVLNGDGPYEFIWSDESQDSEISGLETGYYTVMVIDTNNCATTREVYVGEAIKVEVTPLGESTCGQSNGIAEVTVSGGFPPYKYVWTDGDTLSVDSSLTAGQHFVNVIDSKGCYARGSVIIEDDGSGPEISSYVVSHPECYSVRSGSIDLDIQGGGPPYKYEWSNGEKTEDISGLAAGLYNVSIEDANECMISGSFEIVQPLALRITTAVENATCTGYDGTAAAIVSGGTRPYLYTWSNGSHDPVVKGLAAGIYSVEVEDVNGCRSAKPVIVNDDEGPVVSFTKIQGVGCRTTDNGELQITVEGEGPYTYLWSPNGETTHSLSGLSKGSYSVKVTDKNGCVGVNHADIIQTPPPVNPICLVTVDSATRMNTIVWNKINTVDISHYNIYRESSVKADYRLIGSRDVNDPGHFVDPAANPVLRSWRYRISAVDVCGKESELSPPHKTIHLTMNVGLNETVNLIWDKYEGFDFNTYRIKRYDAVAGWTNLDSLASDRTSLTDDTPPLQTLEYYIEVPHPEGCGTRDKKASSFNSSKSNRKTKLKSGTYIPPTSSNSQEIKIYPNPSTGKFTIRLELDIPGDINLKVFDVSGRYILGREYNNADRILESIINISSYPDGVYQVQLDAGSAIFHRILIKE